MYWTYTSTRPFSNSTEAALFSVALYYWPLTPQAIQGLSLGALTKSLLAAYVGVLIRPTSLILWVFLGGKVLVDAFCLGGLRRALPLALHAAVTGYVV